MAEKKKPSTEVVKSTIDTSVAKFANFENIGEMLKFAQVLLDSKLVPDSFEKPESIVAVITKGKELGFEPMTALANIHDIKGKPSLSVHAIAALVKKAGIRYELTEDFVFIREDGGVDPYKKKDVVYTDIRTTITFYEKFGDKIISTPFSFYRSEAKKMGLLEKGNWKKMIR